MSRNLTTIFDPTDPAHQTVPTWRRLAQGTAYSWRAMARRYARTHGRSQTLLANGDVLRYTKDGTRVRQHTYHHVIYMYPVTAVAA